MSSAVSLQRDQLDNREELVQKNKDGLKLALFLVEILSRPLTFEGFI